MSKFYFTVALSCIFLWLDNVPASAAISAEKQTYHSTLELAGLEHGAYELELQDNFFRRLFGIRKRTVAERSSRSQRHSSSRPERYSPPPTNSQNPGSLDDGRTTRASSSSSRSAVRNEPKGPLHSTIREQHYGIGIWEMGISLGTSHSITDIGASKGLSFGDFTSYHSSNFGLNIGVFTRYVMNEWFALNMGMDFMRLSGEMPNPEVYTSGQAFGFTNDVFEFRAKTEFMLPQLARSPFDVYAFVGIGVFFSDARIYDIEDRTVQTTVDYSQVQPVIPFGMGFSYTLNNSLRIGYEFGWRNTIFHYLDGKNINGNNYDNYFINSLNISFRL